MVIIIKNHSRDSIAHDYLIKAQRLMRRRCCQDKTEESVVRSSFILEQPVSPHKV
ncbi:hypothetical protein SAMN05660479_01592 [Microbulbifer thermotolerans]|nr:hypothetical protein SAMN05660479_01592 [Microbulbifer thermotolerans]